MSNFGVYVGAYPGDFWMAKGCVASIRRHHPEVPICLLWDSDRLPKQQFLAQFEVSCLRACDIIDPELRKLSSGQDGLKMAAIWEGPFERFCYLDADAVVARPLPIENCPKDFRAFKAHGPGHQKEEEIAQWFFSIPEVTKRLPDFEWRNFPYFNAGVFFGFRDGLSKKRYLQLREWQKENPSCYLMANQGILNILVAYEVQKGRISFISEPLQEMITSACTGPRPSTERPIIHWCGASKPFIDSHLCHANLMTEARTEFFKRLSIARFFNKQVIYCILKIEDFIFGRPPAPGRWYHPILRRVHRLSAPLKQLFQ